MVQVGWTLIVFGFTPMNMAGAIDAVVGPFTYWLVLVPPGFFTFGHVFIHPRILEACKASGPKTVIANKFRR